jgi:CxxC motif-containing protein
MRELLCIVCPNGCTLQVEEGEGGIKVSGNKCARGVDFAKAEITNPVRTVTTTVRTAFSAAPVVPVRTDGEIPKGKIRELIGFLASLTVREPLGIGTPVVKNVLDLGVDVILTSNILKEAEYE